MEYLYKIEVLFLKYNFPTHTLLKAARNGMTFGLKKQQLIPNFIFGQSGSKSLQKLMVFIQTDL